MWKKATADLVCKIVTEGRPCAKVKEVDEILDALPDVKEKLKHIDKTRKMWKIRNFLAKEKQHKLK